MDHDRFDTLTRALIGHTTRRQAVAGLAAMAMTFLEIGSSNAARKKRKKKRKQPGTPPAPCVRNCTGKACGDDGCDGNCGSCNGNCDSGVCCPGILRHCNGVCRECCDDTYCAGGRICLQGTCVCAAGTKICPDGTCKECCSHDECQFVPLQFVGCIDGICLCLSGRRSCNGVCCKPEETCIHSANGRICADIVSDRTLKTNVAAADPGEVLRRVRHLPISTWNYTADDPAVRHIGPMAQDFAALFGVGDDDRRIHPVDGQGVALAAIQGLLAEIDRLRAENSVLAARVTALESSHEPAGTCIIGR